jgi:HEAT repeat protein
MESQVVSTGSEGVDFDTLVQDLRHQVWELRRDACEELGARGDVRAIPHLISLLQDGIGAVRFSAAEALGKLNDRSVIPHLLRLLSDPAFGAFGPVIEALANLRAIESVPALIQLLSDPDMRVRGLAGNALMVVSRQVIPFKAKGTDEERNAAIRQWQLWWEANKDNLLRT